MVNLTYLITGPTTVSALWSIDSLAENPVYFLVTVPDFCWREN